MISILAQQDYEAMIEDGLDPSLSDFDRLNCIALRLTDGAETTAANFPRIGWAGDVPFFQPTCIAITWYLTYVKRCGYDTTKENLCWYYALAHARDRKYFSGLHTSDDISHAVDEWMSDLPVTYDEMTRACRYATVGYDDAVAAKTPAKIEEDKTKTEDDINRDTVVAVTERLTTASALTGIRIDDLDKETPSRLDEMIADVKRLHKDGLVRDTSSLRAAYDMTYREIRQRLTEAKRR